MSIWLFVGFQTANSWYTSDAASANIDYVFKSSLLGRQGENEREILNLYSCVALINDSQTIQ